MSSSLRVFIEVMELARDNVRNVQGNEGRRSMGSVGMVSSS